MSRTCNFTVVSLTVGLPMPNLNSMNQYSDHNLHLHTSTPLIVQTYETQGTYYM